MKILPNNYKFIDWLDSFKKYNLYFYDKPIKINDEDMKYLKQLYRDGFGFIYALELLREKNEKNNINTSISIS